jgi:hypothetical protein
MGMTSWSSASKTLRMVSFRLQPRKRRCERPRARLCVPVEVLRSTYCDNRVRVGECGEDTDSAQQVSTCSLCAFAFVFAPLCTYSLEFSNCARTAMLCCGSSICASCWSEEGREERKSSVEKKCQVVSRAVELVGLVKNSVGGRSFCTSDIMSACPTSARTLSTHPYEVLSPVATSSLNCTPPLPSSPKRCRNRYDCVVKESL